MGTNGAATLAASDRRPAILLALVAGAAGSGWVTLGVGSGWVVWTLAAHAALGMATLGIAGLVAGVGRRSGDRSVAWLAIGCVAFTSALGLLHAVGGVTRICGQRVLASHIALGMAALVPAAALVLVHRRRRAEPTDLSRRALLHPGRLVAVALSARAAVEVGGRMVGLPGADRRTTGSYERGSLDPARMPTTQWLGDRRPDIDSDAWRLVVDDGTTTRTLTLAELDAHDDGERVTLDCVSGWFSVQDWAGVSLGHLLGDSRRGRSIVVRSVTGYERRFPVRDADRLLLATRLGGAPLSAGHGHPLRLVAPSRRGFWWVKWVSEIRLDDRPWWLQPPFPLR